MLFQVSPNVPLVKQTEYTQVFLIRQLSLFFTWFWFRKRVFLLLAEDFFGR